MHDIRAVRSDPAGFDAALARRGLASMSSDLLVQDTERRAALTALQEKQARRNALAKEIGQGKRQGADTAALEAEATALRADMDGLEKSVPDLDAGIKRILEALPNILDASVPDGPHGFCHACFSGDYPTPPPTDPNKLRFGCGC